MWRVSCERNRALTARYGMKLWVEFRLILALIRAVNIGGNYSPTLQSGSPFRSEISPCEICGGQSGTETLLSVSTSIFPCRHHSIKAPCMYWSTCCSNREDNWRKPEQFRKKRCCFGNWGAFNRKVLWLSIWRIEFVLLLCAHIFSHDCCQITRHVKRNIEASFML